MASMYLGQNIDAATTEPYFQPASAVIIIFIATWMFWRTWRGQQTWRFEIGSHHYHDEGLKRHEHSHSHSHADDHSNMQRLELALDGFQDAHQREHAKDIRKRFGNGNVTTGQIIVFGLTGGLIPCPAAITVLLLCLQVEEVALGAVLVLCFSLGLAAILISVGAVAAVGARQASNRWPWLGALVRRAPYLSGLLMMGIGVYMGAHAWIGLAR